MTANHRHHDTQMSNPASIKSDPDMLNDDGFLDDPADFLAGTDPDIIHLSEDNLLKLE